MFYPMESSRGLVSFHPGIPQKELHLDMKERKSTWRARREDFNAKVENELVCSRL